MNNEKILRLAALVKVSQEMRGDFEKMTQELKVIVANEGPLKVLVYECYFKHNDSVNYILVKADYHVSIVQQPMTSFTNSFLFTWLKNQSCFFSRAG